MARMSGKSNPNYKTGFTMNKKATGFYNSWQNMKARCLRPNHPKYHLYGGRGIKICSEWLSIIGFSQWALASGWREGLSIDRIDNDGDYEPSNCRWVSMSENSRKKSTTKLSWEAAQKIRQRIKSGEKSTALAKEYGVCHGTIWHIEQGITHVADGVCSKRLKDMVKK